ncbi:MAG: hypothetical protein GX542_03910, partial [Rhodococcus sp.]|nr:hypothetical protein [Rhodococcus sp. (in: high G+C Gram-positive bacteria)]
LTVPLSTTGGIGSEVLQDVLVDLAEHVTARRAAQLVSVLHAEAARSTARNQLEAFLLSDHAVALGARVARDRLPDLVPLEPPLPVNAEQALRSARWWQARMASESTPRRRALMRDVQRHCLRIWASASGAGAALAADGHRPA